MTKIPGSLEESLRDGRVIPFVGAGVSMAVKDRAGEPIFPSWKQLLLDGAKRLELERQHKRANLVRALVEDDQPDYLKAAERLRHGLDSIWSRYLREKIDVSRAKVAAESLALAQAVWRLGSHFVITTNYDKVLHWACPEGERDDLKIWDVNAPAEQTEYLRGELRAPIVWHLHGHIDNAAGLILTPDGYASLYPETGETEPRHRAALQTLRNLLASRSFLFVGFSLDDEHFGVELQGMLDTFEGYGGPHYALVRQRDLERLHQLKRAVRLVPFEDFGEPLLKLLEDLSRHVGPTPDLGPVDVYLAEVADSLRQTRKRVREDLIREGTSVVWDVPPPFEAKGHHQRVTTHLQRARLSVHLLDGYSGLEIEGKPEITYPQEQVRLAREHARSQIIWLRCPLTEVDDAQKAFLTELENGDRGTSSRYRFCKDMPPSELVRDILVHLRREESQSEEPQSVLLESDPKDEKMLGEVDDLLRKYHVLTHIHHPQGDLRRDTERLTDRLRRVSALVICHGQMDALWVRSHLDEALTAALGSLKLICVYLAPPPPEKDLQLLDERYKVLQDLKRVALLPNPNGHLEDRIFAPLFDTLGVGSTA